jgi:hypothetical protein
LSSQGGTPSNTSASRNFTEQLKLVRSPLEAGLPIQPEDRDETIDIKGKCSILQTVFVKVGPLTPTVTDAEGQDVVWSGRNGWLKEYNQISRHDQDLEGSDDADSSKEYSSDYQGNSEFQSCTVNLDANNFE